MTENKFITIFKIYLGVFVLFTAIFIASFHFPLFIKQNVLFYRGLYLIILDLLATLAIVAIIYHFHSNLKKETLFSALIFSLSINLCFFVIFPVTFDRSVTTFLLNTLKERKISNTCNGLTENNLESFLVDEYVKKEKAVHRRINEQSIIKFIQDNNGCFSLTNKGKDFLKFSNVIKGLYGLK